MFFLAISSVNWKDPLVNEHYERSKLPNVTIQLPVFNEANVINRTLTGITKLVYPCEKIFIQILDDSTDQTSSIIDSKDIKQELWKMV
jgi:cellulose synthase/poly-beta-1,6-N-acetylglucosamine synthase-like glycosyltransferase